MSLTPTVPGTSIYAALRGSATLLPLRHRIFAALWTASLASNFGSLIQSVGASWLMTSIAPSPDMVALVPASTMLPILLFSLAAGAIADIWDGRLVMLIAQGFMLAVSFGLVAIAYAGDVGPWTLISFTFALGVGAALYGPAWQAAVRDLVPREHIQAAVALNSLNFNLARSVGPAIGGLVVAAWGPKAAFLVNAFSYVGLIIVLSRWRPPREEKRLPAESMGRAMAMGIRYVSLSPAIRTVLARAGCFGFCGSVIWALLPVVARHLIGGGPFTYGILLGALGVGAIVGAIMTAPLRRRYSSDSLILVAMVVFGISSILIGHLSSAFPMVLALIGIGGAWVLALSIYNVSVQMSSPQWVLARSMAIYQTLAIGGMAVGSWIWGKIADLTSVSLSLTLAGIVTLTTLLLVRRFPLPVEAADVEPSGVLPHPEVNLDFDPRNGPIVVSIQYCVNTESARAFVTAMEDLRRMRRRDGGRNWMLLQDIAAPELWLERFEVATWLDHIRQRHRLTNADIAIFAKVRSFHVGPEPPQTRRYLERPMVALGAKVPLSSQGTAKSAPAEAGNVMREQATQLQGDMTTEETAATDIQD